MTSNVNIEAETLKTHIDEQANLVRQLKSNSTSTKVCHKKAIIALINMIVYFLSFFKEEITAAVEGLLKLKEQYKALTGNDAPSSGAAPPRKEKEKKPASAPAPVKKAENDHSSSANHTDVKKETK